MSIKHPDTSKLFLFLGLYIYFCHEIKLKIEMKKASNLFTALALGTILLSSVSVTSCNDDSEIRVYKPIEKMHIGEPFVYDYTLNNIKQGDSVIVLNFYKDEVTDLDYVEYDEINCQFVFKKGETSKYRISWDFDTSYNYISVQYGQNGMWYNMNKYGWNEYILTANDGMTVRMATEPNIEELNLTVSKFTIEDVGPLYGLDE